MLASEPGTRPAEQSVSLRRVSVVRGTQRILSDIDLDVQRGEFVAIRGQSGSGKSTLLNVIGLLDRPTSGTVSFSGEDVGDMSDRQRSGIRAQCIGFVFQKFHLLHNRTALENVALGNLYIGASSSARLAEAEELLTRIALGHRMDALPATLSGGEQQRVALARARPRSHGISRHPPV